jgi:hypothetical protein
VQNAIKAETLPELIADVDRPGFTMLLGGDPSWIDGDQLRTAGRPGRRRVLTALSYLMNDGGDFGIALIDQALLTEQGILNLARKTEPFFAWPRAEVAEGTDGLPARPLWGLHGLNEDVIGVRPALVGARRFADVHVPPRIKFVSLRITSSRLLPGRKQNSFSHYLQLAQSPSSKINNIAAGDCASAIQFPQGTRRLG